jgi:GGDEF domain-containing protein
MATDGIGTRVAPLLVTDGHEPLTPDLPNAEGAGLAAWTNAAIDALGDPVEDLVVLGPRPVVLVDLDDFKHVNDTHGHHVGDRLLVAVADRLRHAATTYRGVACRLAGDEFLLLLPGLLGDVTEPVAEILRGLEGVADIDAGDTFLILDVSASAGITIAC